MFTHIVFLRGVNVGKAKQVPMATFKRILRDLGCDDVVTVLNSGNAVVSNPKASSKSLVSAIAAALRSSFGFEVPVVVKTVRDFSSIINGNALVKSCTNHSRLLVVVTQERRDLVALKRISTTAKPGEQFLLGPKAGYLHCPNGVLASDAAKAILSKMGNAITTRTWVTMLKLHECSTRRVA